MEKEEEDAMEGHAMVPLQGLRLELPGGEIAVGYSTDASALQEEISSLRSRRRHVDRRRREALDRLIDLKGSVRVFCRVRPLVRTNYSFNTESPPVTVVEQERIAVKSAGIKKEFSADRVFGQESTQEDVFQEVKPVLRSALDGHNVCVLAYGQTGTGKTYTMEGTDGKLGIVPRAIQELFSRASEDGSCAYSFSMSMLEVYLGSLRDLLAPRQPLFRPTECKTACNLSILATKNGAVEVEGLTDVSTPDVKKASQWYRRGRRARSTSWTNVNDVSSRSHCLTRITIRRRRRRGGGTEGGGVSKLWLVDLGGSERLLKTGASGLTMDEGKAINLSLSALGDVIAALRRKRGHVPYRNSKLTQILSDSLGDGSKVLMVVHVSLSEDDVGETVCSLNFAKRARSIETNREIPQDLKTLRQKRLAELDREIRAAEEELERLDEQIRRAEETSLEEEEEKKKAKLLASSVCQALSDGEKGSPRSTLVVVGHTDATESPCATEKARSRRPASRGSAAPHFMSSTVCSRQRRCAGSHCVGKPRLTTMSVNRYPAAAAAAELSGSQSQSQSQSQSFGYSGCKNNAAKVRSAAAALSSGAPRMRCLPAKSDQINVISNSSVDSTAASAPRRRESCFGSRPVRQRAAAPLHQHRRRMSSLT